MRFLESRGYRVLERNFLCRRGEVDIVAEEGDVLCFIEVRSRSSSRFGGALETINLAKQRRIVIAARHYIARTHADDRPCRFDVVTFDDNAHGDSPAALLRDAFDLSTL